MLNIVERNLVEDAAHGFFQTSAPKRRRDEVEGQLTSLPLGADPSMTMSGVTMMQTGERSAGFNLNPASGSPR